MGIAEYSGGKLVFDQVIVKEIQKRAPGDGNPQEVCNVGLGILILALIGWSIQMLVAYRSQVNRIQQQIDVAMANRRGLRVGRTLRGPDGGEERCV